MCHVSTVLILSWGVTIAVAASDGADRGGCSAESPNAASCSAAFSKTQGTMLLQRKQETLEKEHVSFDGEDETKVAVGYKSRDDIPSGCVLPDDKKLADGAKCMFSDQCQSNRCCPYLHTCNPPLTTEQVKADPLLKDIMWSSKYGGNARCGKDVCDVCSYRNTPQEYQCTEVNGGPILEGNELAGFMPLWNVEDKACKCDDRFLEAMHDGSWVPECGGGAGGRGGDPNRGDEEEEADDVCVTTGSSGVGAGVACAFPFMYSGVEYNSCTTVDGGGSRWCFTEVDSKGNGRNGKWGLCGDNCADEGEAETDGSAMTRADIPSGCELPADKKLPAGARCLFSDQCQGGKCCPYLHTCDPPLSTDQVESDPLLKAIMWSKAHGGDSSCGKDFCDVCAYRSTPQEYQCTEVNGGPILPDSALAGFMPLWDLQDPKCKCDWRFLESMLDGTWVPACQVENGGSGSGSGQTGGNGGKKPRKPTKKNTKKPRKTKKPTPSPTPSPTSSPTEAPKVGGIGNCKNSPGYTDPNYGLSCAEWIGYDCTGFDFSDDLVRNCPCSCGACDSDTYKDPTWGDGCRNWNGYRCTGYAFTEELQANCPSACKTC